MNLIDKDALIEALGIETDCYDCEHERLKYHCDLDPVEACTKIVEAPVVTVTTESAEKAIEVLKNAAWLGAVYSFEETEEAVKTAIRALQVASNQYADVSKKVDLISRADVCEILSDMYPTDGEKVVRTKCIDTAYDAVLQLPTAQPEIIRCKDCVLTDGHEPIADGRYWCMLHGAYMYYCSAAERRTDE